MLELLLTDMLALVPDPRLQSDVFVCCDRADLASRWSVSSREIPLLTAVNGTLMARRSC